MRRLAGQAARRAGRALHILAGVAIAIGVLGGGLLGLAAWRLSQGPLELPWLTQRLQAAANQAVAPAKLTIGSAALTWEGFRLGVDRPLDLRLTGITFTDGVQHLEIPRAEISLALLELLLGQAKLRAVEIDQAQFALVRAEDGTIRFDLSSTPTDQSPPADQSPSVEAAERGTKLVTLLGQLARPATTDAGDAHASVFSQLQRVLIADASVVVTDHRLHTVWRAPLAQIDLMRAAVGGVTGNAELTVALGDERVRLTASGALGIGDQPTRLRARLAPVAPASLARAVGVLAPLAVVDAPVSGEVTIELGHDLELQTARLTARVGAGEVHIDSGSVKLADATLVAEDTAGTVALRTLQVRVQGHDRGLPTRLTAEGELRHSDGRITADLTLGLDQVDFADLKHLWPQGAGGGVRSWIIENITAGVARDGHVSLGLVATQDFHEFSVTRAAGTLDGDDLTVSWLRPVPPIERGRAQLRIADPDSLDIVVLGGHQAARNGAGGLDIRSGNLRITGMMQPHQVATIDADISGTVPDAVALLTEPPLHLLDSRPIDLKSASGQVSAKLSLKFPLEETVTIDNVTVRVQAHLDALRLPSVVAGRDLDGGVLDLNVTTDGMQVSGQAQLAGIPAQLDATMDFRPGGPTQVLQRFSVSGRPDATQLSAAGLTPDNLFDGALALQATLMEYRSGLGDLAVTGDLRDASFRIAELGWTKPTGQATKVQLHAVLQNDRLTAIDTARVDGDGITLRGSADFAGGRPTVLHLDQVVLGQTQARGSLRLPAGNLPYVANISGSRLDLSGLFGARERSAARDRAKADQPRGVPWTVDAKFDRVMLAQGRTVTGVVGHAENDGLVFRRLHVTGRNGGTAPFDLDIAPQPNGRHLKASAADAGELLRDADIIETMQGGRLSVAADFDDRLPDHPLAGSATIEDFRMRNAPALARLLQAMTLYGLVEAVQGQGLGFTRLIAPFRLTDAALELSEARAFSSSLGITAKGRFDRLDDRVDLSGTIVPAYFFNSLLGNIPLLGRLFSPEQGGGVFAASYTVRGPINDPQVSVNPLSALTPGILRNLFGLF